jgi:hypothetical protein
MRYDQQGRPYYIDHINRRSTYDDPRVQTGSYAGKCGRCRSLKVSPIQFPVIYYETIILTSVGPAQPQYGYQPTPQTVYQNPQRVGSGSFPPVNQNPNVQNVGPVTTPVVAPVQQQPLPQGWEMRYDQQGRPYYIDHINRRSTYDDPRVQKATGMESLGKGVTAKLVVSLCQSAKMYNSFTIFLIEILELTITSSRACGINAYITSAIAIYFYQSALSPAESSVSTSKHSIP